MFRRLTTALALGAMLLTGGVIAPAASAATTSTITGTLEFPESSTSRYANVSLYDASTADIVRELRTNSAGSFEFVDVPLGDYKLKFDPSDRAMLDSWWRNSSDWANSETIHLTGDTPVVLSASIVRGASVSGRLRSDPIELGPGSGTTTVYIYPVGSSTYLTAHSVTAGGEYSLVGLPAGSYNVRAINSTEGVVDQWWDQVRDRVNARVVTVGESQQLTGIDITLQHEGSISGTVTLPADIDPTVPTLVATATSVNGNLPTRRGQVAVDGTFRITELEPGPYVVSIADTSSPAVIATQYYPAASSSATATEVTVPSGGEISVSMVLRKLLPSGSVSLSTNSPVVGREISATLSLGGVDLTGASFTYRWYADDEMLAAEPDSAFVVPLAAEGKRIRADVELVKAGYGPRTYSSARTYYRALRTGVPSIVGDLRVDSTLTAAAGSWTPGSNLTYAWYLDGEHVSADSTLRTYSWWVGLSVTLRVSGTLPGYSSASESTSEAVVAAGILTAATPKIVGNPRVGQMLTATGDAWAPSTTGLTYQWNRDGKAIMGATANAYMVDADDRNAHLTVSVTGRSYGYETKTVTSAEVGPVPWVFVPPTVSPFSDMTPSSPFYREVTWLASTGITGGYPDGTYRPAGSVTRGAMAAFLYRSMGRPAFTAPKVSPFSDMKPTSAFYKEVTWLESTGITGGYPDGTYRPAGSVTRGAMAAFLYRSEGRPAFTPPKVSPFTDMKPTSAFYKEVTWLQSTGITGGYPDGTYRPAGSVTRGAMAAFLYRMSH